MTDGGGGRRPPPAAQGGGGEPSCGSPEDAFRSNFEMEEDGRSLVHAAAPASVEGQVGSGGPGCGLPLDVNDGDLVMEDDRSSQVLVASLAGEEEGSLCFRGVLGPSNDSGGHGRRPLLAVQEGEGRQERAGDKEGCRRVHAMSSGLMQSSILMEDEEVTRAQVVAPAGDEERCRRLHTMSFGQMQSSPAALEAAGFDDPMVGFLESSSLAGREEATPESLMPDRVVIEMGVMGGSSSAKDFCMGSSHARCEMDSCPAGSRSYVPIEDVQGSSVAVMEEVIPGRHAHHQSNDSMPGASRTRACDVRENAYVGNPSARSPRAGQDYSLHKKDGFGSAWQQPRLVALPPVADLGKFSVDGATVILDSEEVEATSQRFAAALVGRLYGRRIPFLVLTGELRRRWAAYGNIRIVTMSGDCFVCFFDSVGARDAALMGGPWVLFGQVLGVDCWTPSFSPGSSIAYSTPVWIRMPRLPLYCWSSRNIARIAAIVGEPLWMDGATAELERAAYARACVRIDLAKPLKSGVWVEGPHGKFFQPLEYEGLSVFCCRCSRVGHKEAACTRAPHVDAAQTGRSSSLSGSREGVGLASPSPTKVISLVQDCRISSTNGKETSKLLLPNELMADMDGSVDKGVGPWMIVERRRRPNKPSVMEGGRFPRHRE